MSAPLQTPVATPTSAFLADLHARGQVQNVTDLASLDKHLQAGSAHERRAYVGFDPTADSLTIGNLVGIMALARWQRAGHTPVALMGGGTGMIGDPSGKSAERSLQTVEQVQANVQAISKSFANLLDQSNGLNQAIIVNNYQWLSKISYLEALRDIGKFFSVNQMVQRDSVKNRLENREQGISYTEFSYMILQAYDYAHLYKDLNVSLQMGGSDQWGNIVSGIDLIRRYAFRDAGGQDGAGEGASQSVQAFGLTWPLVTKSDGTKFGKTESGAIWLSPARTSPYQYYQFWLNASDSDVERFLRTFTFLTVQQISEILASSASDPGQRLAQRTLAREATALLHGITERDKAEAAGQALFSGNLAALDGGMLAEVFASVASTSLGKNQLEGEGIAVLDVLVTVGLCKSKGEARQALADGSVSVNGTKVSPTDRLTTASLLAGSVIALRRGKKNWHLTKWA